MGRGLGSRERQVLHRAYHDPVVAPSGRRFVHVLYDLEWRSDSELSALYRAVRRLRDKGLVGGQFGSVEPLAVEPVFSCPTCLSVQNVEDPDSSEHLREVG